MRDDVNVDATHNAVNTYPAGRAAGVSARRTPFPALTFRTFDSPEPKGERRVASQGTLKAPTDESEEPILGMS